jgi:hypothetical protein
LLYWYKSTSTHAGFAGFSRLVFLELHDVARIAMTSTKGRELPDALYKRMCERFGLKQPVSRSRAVPYAQVFKPSSLPLFFPRNVQLSSLYQIQEACVLDFNLLYCYKKQNLTQLPQVFSFHPCTECKRPASSKNSEEYLVTTARNSVKRGWMCEALRYERMRPKLLVYEALRYERMRP